MFQQRKEKQTKRKKEKKKKKKEEKEEEEEEEEGKKERIKRAHQSKPDTADERLKFRQCKSSPGNKQ